MGNAPLLKIPVSLYTDSFPINMTLAPANTARGGFMRRCCSGLVLVTAVSLILALTGCLGSSTSTPSNGGVRSVSINPTGNISLEVGSSQVFTASALDANGRAISGVEIQFVVSSP